MAPTDTAFIWGDRNALMRDADHAPRDSKGPASENNYREMMEWGSAFTDLIALTEPCLSTLFGGEFRLDHFYLNLLRSGNRVTSRNLHGSPFGAGTYNWHAAGPKCTGLVTVALELMPVRPGDGGFACVEGSHKQNVALPREVAVLEEPYGTEAAHPFARAVPADAGSAIVFTEALVHGTWGWSGANERRTVFLKYCPIFEAFISDYPVPEWVPAEERAMLSDATRRILRPPARDGGSHQREAMLREARL